MKVLLDYQVFGWQKYGGISRYFYELATRLKKKCEVSVISPLYVNNYLNQGGIDKMGLHIPAVRRTGRIINMINSFISPIFIRFNRPDILHETYYSNHSITPKGCPTVITVFDMVHEKYPENVVDNNSLSTSKRISFYKRLAVERANKIICISKNTQQDLIEMFDVPPEKTVVIPLGFTLINQDKNLVSTKMTRPFFLYVGQRQGYKNFKALLKAYSSFCTLYKDYDLVAFGGGGFSPREKNLICDLGLAKSVYQLSGNDQSLSSLYSQSIAFVYPSLYEGFGIPPLEAMSFDCPVLCSNKSSIPEVVADAALLFDPENIDSIIHALESVVNSSDLRDELIKKGNERIKNFSWDKTANETIKVYQELL